jgi:hypothetical protein
MPTTDGLFVGEERDPAAREASFFCVDAADGTVLWERRSLGEGWWTGFAGCSGGVVLLQGFAAPDLPQPLKIFAVDVRSGTSLWADLSVVFETIRGNEVHAVTPTGEPVALDLHTGARLPGRGAAGIAPSAEDELHFPAQIDLESDSAVSAVKAVLEGQPVGPAEVLEVAGHLVVGYCVQNRKEPAGVLEQHLAVIYPDRAKVVHAARILEKTTLQLPDTFFGRHRMLYYIEERRQLVGVKFPDN